MDKKRMSVVFSILSVLLAFTAYGAPQTVKLKGAIKFLSEAPLEKIVGTADGAGNLTIDANDLTAIKGSLNVAVASMKTGNDTRDSHLMSDKWLDAEKHPTISFTPKSVKLVEPVVTKGAVKIAKLAVTGDFSLHGVTKSLTTEAQLKWKGDKYKLKTQLTIALGDYDVKGTQDTVGSKVGKTIDIQVRLRGMATP